jgi:hypothetical protein
MTTQTNIQWKGTDACLDFSCLCGQQSHIDGFTFSYIKCFKCGQTYQLDFNVSTKPVTEEEAGGGGLMDIERSQQFKREQK